MLRGQLDAAPFVMVFFLVLIFILLGSLTFTPGVSVRLPIAEGFPGTANPTISVAVDPADRLYFQNQMVTASELGVELAKCRREADEQLTLIVHADRDVTYETLVRVTQLARDAGIQEALLATLPRLQTPGRPSLSPDHEPQP